MKKLLLFVLVLLSVVLGYSLKSDNGILPTDNSANLVENGEHKKQILRVAVVSDSANENGLLAKSLEIAKGKGINFVIGLGDWTDVGTLDELEATKKTLDDSGLKYFVTAGDHDLWDSRNRGEEALTNFSKVFGKATRIFGENGIQFVLLNDSDIYKGISGDDWETLSETVSREAKLKFVFAHKTPFHPSSAHILGADSSVVSAQAQSLIDLLESKNVDGFFSGDLHFFAEFKSPSGSVRITTIGAVASERNFQGPRFGILTVYDDYSWEVEDIEIR